jgi:leucine dehydrogenase
VFVSIQAGARAVLGRSDLQGLSVALQGLGAVGWHLAEFLHKAGARLVVADIDAAKCERARSEFGATVLGIDQILAAEVDVLAPCALGASLSATSIPTLRTRLVCGAANNQRAMPSDGTLLAGRNIVYLPDYLVNAGGIISVAREYRGEGEEAAVMTEVSRIGERVVELLERCKTSGRTPAAEADAWAQTLI